MSHFLNIELHKFSNALLQFQQPFLAKVWPKFALDPMEKKMKAIIDSYQEKVPDKGELFYELLLKIIVILDYNQ